MQNHWENVGEYIQSGIRAGGRSKKEIAVAVGYDPSALSNVLNGRDLPSLDRIKRFCDELKTLNFDVASRLLALDQRKRNYPTSYKCFRVGVQEATDAAAKLAKESGEPTIVSLSTTWLHTDDLHSSYGVWSNILSLVDFCERHQEAKVQFRFMTISSREIGILVSRRLAFHLERIRKDGLGSEGPNAILARLILEDFEELLKTRAEIAKLQQRISRLENLKFEHRNSLAWVGYPMLIVRDELAVRGMYAVSEGFCTSPATPCLFGSKDYQICDRDFDLSWSVAVEESDPVSDRGALEAIIKDYLDRHYRKRIDQVLDTPLEPTHAVVEEAYSFA